MVLNRTVCIDYPEFDVPWFHTKYCEEFQSMGKIFYFYNVNSHTNYLVSLYCVIYKFF